VSDILEKDQVILHCQNLIQQFEDIVSAKILTDAQGKVTEIRVISKSDRSPKEIVKDIEAALITFLGAEVDKRKINVAQINKKILQLVESKLKVQGISTHQTQNHLEVEVLLVNAEGSTFAGNAKGTASFQSRMGTTAHATISAIQQFAGESFLISLDDICAFNIGDYQAVAVLVSVLNGGSELQLLGSALVAHDIHEAVAQAVMNAINVITR